MSSKQEQLILPFRAPQPSTRVLANQHADLAAELLPIDDNLETIELKHHTWNVRDWAQREVKQYGPVFQQVTVFPRGNHCESVSIYLQHGYTTGNLPQDWYACVQFAIVVWNPDQPSKYLARAAPHRFNGEESDWGFTKFCDRTHFRPGAKDGPHSPLISNGAVNITAHVRVLRDPTGLLWNNPSNYDVREATGMIGMVNLGATDYLNCVVQIFYHLAAFRKAIYQTPTPICAPADKVWALQHVFYELQTSGEALNNTKLPTSFGWDSKLLFVGQDAQEFLTMLLDSVEERLKLTPKRDTVPDLFLGRERSSISSNKIDYTKSSIQEFKHIRLNVRNNKTLNNSFLEYLNTKQILGYETGETHGKQDVNVRISFDHLPPVLFLYLNRTEYNLRQDKLKKIQDYHEYPEELDMTPYLSDGVDKKEPWLYSLFAVVIHAGTVHGGTYSTYIRPTVNGQFYLFDDHIVTKATLNEALNKPSRNYRSLEPANPHAKGLKTPTILVYVRQRDAEVLLAPLKDNDVPLLIHRAAQDERIPAHFAGEIRGGDDFIEINIVFYDNFLSHEGFDLLPPNFSGTPTRTYSKLSKRSHFADFIKKVASDHNLKIGDFRAWPMQRRQNKTTRPYLPIVKNPLLADQLFGRRRRFQLWIEKGNHIGGNWDDPAAILVFLKRYKALDQKLELFGHVYVQSHAKLKSLCSIIEAKLKRQVLQLRFYEEIKPGMIIDMGLEKSFEELEIQNGDIICFQESQHPSATPYVRYKTAPEYYEHLAEKLNDEPWIPK
ncbi:Ubiquitin carboxyl-terminal hydrolase 7 [Myotisia sp. PD_48]|nr:Ubiquitin carboxyl-terminal hydrolase 7 [Myotisia sp. PD_48]